MRVPKLIEARALEPVLAVGLAVAAAAVTLIVTAPHGPRVSTDSIYYLSAADSLRAGRGLVSFDGAVMTIHAPGFPVAVAAAGKVAGSSADGARILNALCLAAAVVLGWLLLGRVVRSKALRLVGVVGIASAPTLFWVSTAAWSEPLFIALVLAAVLALQIALERRNGWLWLALAGFLAGSSIAVRYSGLWLVASGVVIVLIARRRWADAGERIRRAGLFLLPAGVVPALVIWHNLRHTDGEPFGYRGHSEMSLGHALSDTATGIARWLVPEGATSAVRLVVIGAVVLTAAIRLVSLRRSPAASGRGDAPAPDRQADTRPAPLWPLALLVSAYLGFLAVTEATESLDPVDRRLLSPVFVLGVVLALGAIARRPRGAAGHGAWIAVGAVAAAAWAVAELQTTVSDLHLLRRDGAGFAETRYRHSPLAAVIRRRRITPTFSNMPDATYYLTGARTGCWPTTAYTICQHQALPLSEVMTIKRAYLSWFANPGALRPVVPRAVASQVEVTPVVTVSDGGLYAVRARR